MSLEIVGRDDNFLDSPRIPTDLTDFFVESDP